MRPEQLATANWGAVPDTLPVIMLSFVFHNIVGTIATSLEGDVQKIRYERRAVGACTILGRWPKCLRAAEGHMAKMPVSATAFAIVRYLKRVPLSSVAPLFTQAGHHSG